LIDEMKSAVLLVVIVGLVLLVVWKYWEQRKK